MEVQSVAVEERGAFAVELVVYAQDGDWESGFGAGDTCKAQWVLFCLISFVALVALIIFGVLGLRVFDVEVPVQIDVEVDGAVRAEKVAPYFIADLAGESEKRGRRHVVLVHCYLFDSCLLGWTDGEGSAVGRGESALESHDIENRS